MKVDMRSRAKVPFGYKIVEGKAVIDQEEVVILWTFFTKFLEGKSMAEAARAAKFPGSSAVLSAYIHKPEYVGTDFYPAIISEEYQKKLIDEYETRKGKCYLPKERPVKGVRLYKEFRFAKKEFPHAGDPADCVEAYYRGIEPKTEQKDTRVPGR